MCHPPTHRLTRAIWNNCQSVAAAIEPFGIQAIKRCHWMQNFSRVLAIFVFKSPFSTRKKLWPTWWPMWGPTRVQSGSQKVVVTFQPLRLGPRKQKKMESPRNSTQVRHAAMVQIPNPPQLWAHWAVPHHQSGKPPPKPSVAGQTSRFLLRMGF